MFVNNLKLAIMIYPSSQNTKIITTHMLRCVLISMLSPPQYCIQHLIVPQLTPISIHAFVEVEVEAASFKQHVHVANSTIVHGRAATGPTKQRRHHHHHHHQRQQPRCLTTFTIATTTRPRPP